MLVNNIKILSRRPLSQKPKFKISNYFPNKLAEFIHSKIGRFLFDKDQFQN